MPILPRKVQYSLKSSRLTVEVDGVKTWVLFMRGKDGLLSVGKRQFKVPIPFYLQALKDMRLEISDEQAVLAFKQKRIALFLHGQQRVWARRLRELATTEGILAADALALTSAAILGGSLAAGVVYALGIAPWLAVGVGLLIAPLSAWLFKMSGSASPASNVQSTLVLLKLFSKAGRGKTH